MVTHLNASRDGVSLSLRVCGCSLRRQVQDARRTARVRSGLRRSTARPKRANQPVSYVFGDRRPMVV